MIEQFTIEWVDGHQEPQGLSSPEYPEGVHLDLTGGKSPSCLVDLPYPAKRCGHYVIACEVCGFRAACTTAGRLDDPRIVLIPCHPEVK